MGNIHSQITLPFRTPDLVNPHFGFHVLKYTEARQRERKGKEEHMAVCPLQGVQTTEIIAQLYKMFT